jgi:hypothetical protein
VPEYPSSERRDRRHRRHRLWQPVMRRHDNDSPPPPHINRNRAWLTPHGSRGRQSSTSYDSVVLHTIAFDIAP